ncbi:MAG: hypothetical protein K6T26_05225 [Alicyclobacillus sp.]|nr:hypothetical protein [Alicyclobacillus sp.]
MYLFAVFSHSLDVELLLGDLASRGLGPDHVLAIPLDEKRSREVRLLDTLHRSDGYSLLDVTAILGTAGMLLGTVYGFVLPWGPIVCASVGLLGFALVGLGLDLMLGRERRRLGRPRRLLAPEVALVIHCPARQADTVEQLLWHHQALSIGRWQDVSHEDEAGARAEDEVVVEDRKDTSVNPVWRAYPGRRSPAGSPDPAAGPVRGRRRRGRR